ncbi:MAG: hypothetical protein V4549_00330 [Bacteroidota bacterium]
MRISIALILFFLMSCNPKTENESKGQFSEAQSRYVINSNINGKSIYITVETDNDTVYLYKFKDSVETKLKILSNKEAIAKIKETVKFHMELSNFYKNQAKTLHGDMVRFYIDHSGNRLEAKYSQIDGYTDVSPEFDSLINYLKKQDVAFKDFL